MKSPVSTHLGVMVMILRIIYPINLPAKYFTEFQGSRNSVIFLLTIWGRQLKAALLSTAN
jgi:hypothetical protein